MPDKNAEANSCQYSLIYALPKAETNVESERERERKRESSEFACKSPKMLKTVQNELSKRLRDYEYMSLHAATDRHTRRHTQTHTQAYTDTHTGTHTHTDRRMLTGNHKPPTHF